MPFNRSVMNERTRSRDACTAPPRTTPHSQRNRVLASAQQLTRNLLQAHHTTHIRLYMRLHTVYLHDIGSHNVQLVHAVFSGAM
jgi:hypothetical protein